MLERPSTSKKELTLTRPTSSMYSEPTSRSMELLFGGRPGNICWNLDLNSYNLYRYRRWPGQPPACLHPLPQFASQLCSSQYCQGWSLCQLSAKIGSFGVQGERVMCSQSCSNEIGGILGCIWIYWSQEQGVPCMTQDLNETIVNIQDIVLGFQTWSGAWEMEFESCI